MRRCCKVGARAVTHDVMVLVPLAISLMGGDSSKRGSDSDASIRYRQDFRTEAAMVSEGHSLSNVDMLESGSAREFVERDILRPYL